MKSILLACVLVTGALFSQGCSKPAARPPQAPPSVEYYTHTVKYSGETLAQIAKWRTGSAQRWREILEHNPGLDVRRLRIGTTIQIPTDWVTNMRAMPASAVAVATTRPSAITPAVQPAAETESVAVEEVVVAEEAVVEQVAAVPVENGETIAVANTAIEEVQVVDPLAPPQELTEEERLAKAAAQIDQPGDVAFPDSQDQVIEEMGDPSPQAPPQNAGPGLVGRFLKKIVDPTPVAR